LIEAQSQIGETSDLKKKWEKYIHGFYNTQSAGSVVQTLWRAADVWIKIETPRKKERKKESCAQRLRLSITHSVYICHCRR